MDEKKLKTIPKKCAFDLEMKWKKRFKHPELANNPDYDFKIDKFDENYLLDDFENLCAGIINLMVTGSDTLNFKYEDLYFYEVYEFIEDFHENFDWKDFFTSFNYICVIDKKDNDLKALSGLITFTSRFWDDNAWMYFVDEFTYFILINIKELFGLLWNKPKFYKACFNNYINNPSKFEENYNFQAKLASLAIGFYKDKILEVFDELPPILTEGIKNEGTN